MPAWAWFPIGYLAGSVPFGVLVARARGVDLRAVGSGNIGATNAGRAMGWRWGALVLALDFAKGALPAWLAPPEAAVLAGGASVLGHVLPVWLGFRGGKGVATAAGAFSVLMPWAMLAAAMVWAATILAFRYVSLASIVAAVALPAAAVVAGADRARLALAAGVAVLVVARHRDNIARLIAGDERRV